jgi:DNA-binding transcriptional LysR family regulator
MLNPDHLRTFLTVAETGSFTAAATQLGFTQPAVSQHIKALEAQIGEIRLFRRVGKTMRLTHAGEELLAHAREVIDLVVRTEQHMLSLRGQVTGRIGIGCAPSSGERLLPALLAAFHHKYPAVQFAVDVGLAQRLLGWLDNGQVQAALLDEHPRRRTYDVLELGSEAVVAVAARDHALLSQAEAALSDLVLYPLILPQRGMVLRRRLEDLLRRHGIVLEQSQVVLETDSITVATHAVVDSMGIAFIPQSRAPKTPDLGIISLPDLQIEQAWFLIRQRSTITNRAVEALWSFAAGDAGRAVLNQQGLHIPIEYAMP